jgi:hypothetical protein
LEDIEAANKIAPEVLGRSLDELRKKYTESKDEK